MSETREQGRQDGQQRIREGGGGTDDSLFVVVRKIGAGEIVGCNGCDAATYEGDWRRKASTMYEIHVGRASTCLSLCGDCVHALKDALPDPMPSAVANESTDTGDEG